MEKKSIPFLRRTEEQQEWHISDVLCCLLALLLLPVILVWKVIRLLGIIAASIILTVVQFVMLCGLLRDK